MFKKIPHVEYERSSEKIDQDTRTKVVQALHREANAYGERRDSSMSFLVLGAIFLVIGFIFLMLSYKPYISAERYYRIFRTVFLKIVYQLVGNISLGYAA